LSREILRISVFSDFPRFALPIKSVLMRGVTLKAETYEDYSNLQQLWSWKKRKLQCNNINLKL